MTLEGLIARYRIDSNDKEVPHFVTDSEVAAYLDEAQREAVLRGRLIHESADADVCRIPVVVGQSTYPLHPALYELDHCAFKEDGQESHCKVALVSTEWLDANVRDWRDAQGKPQYAVQSDKDVRLIPQPAVSGELILEGYRFPLEPLAADKLDAEPEIAEAHHAKLVLWALHRAFSIPDSEFFDPSRASLAEGEFTRYFGLRPSSDLRRITREDVPQHVEAFWP